MNNLKYVIRLVVVMFALYVLKPSEALCRASWSGVKGFVRGIKEYRSEQAHRAFPPWSYTKQLLDEINRMRKEGE